MNLRPNLPAILLCGLALAGCFPADAALPVDWRHEQHFTVSAPGLVKFSLPVGTLDAARPALEDLRLYDEAGNELPFLIERPVPASRAILNPRSFQLALNPATTVITLETGLAQPIEGVTLETAAQNFIKAVRVEASADGRNWQLLAQGQPVFRQPPGASQLHLAFPAAVSRWLRLTVDDQRSPPVPFTGARLHTAPSQTAPAESQPVSITSRNENPGETRLTLNLGAANLDVASLTLETAEPLFTRAVTITMPQLAGDSIREQIVGQGLVYRVAVEGQPAVARLVLPLEMRVRSRELVLLIHNEDSPPLPVTAVRVERRPVYLVFLARQGGTFHLLTGNKSCPAPRYDLAALASNLVTTVVAPVQVSPPNDNPDFRVPEALAGLEVTGAPLDVSAWKFRKPVQLARGGAQQTELDLDTLAHADAGLADLRVLRGSNQVPYIIQRTSLHRAITPVVAATNDPKNPGLSRWILKLPRAGVPISRLAFETTTHLFQRQFSVAEELTDERGDKYRRPLGGAAWTQTPERKSVEFSLALNETPQSDVLFLETGNGDNPPVVLEKFVAFYPATRLLFKAAPGDQLFLYYGNPRAAAPAYDLNLVAGELLAADQAPAPLGPEEQLKKSAWSGNPVTASGGVLFWAILALVVIGLLVIISRLLPKSAPPA